LELSAQMQRVCRTSDAPLHAEYPQQKQQHEDGFRCVGVRGSDVNVLAEKKLTPESQVRRAQAGRVGYCPSRSICAHGECR
jgi:hypothetical protein